MSGEARDRPGGGPFDQQLWPEQLTAHAVTPGPRPRLHGYDVEDDLARHYSFADLALLALTGELPAPGAARAFEVGLLFLAPASIATAPVHAAVLGRICAAPPAAVLGIGAIGLAEQARSELDAHAELLAWLDAPSGPLPAAFRCPSPAEAEAVQRLRTALATTELVRAIPSGEPSLLAALLALLHACGLRRSAQLEAALVLARLPCLAAEALAATPGAFSGYPINLPRFAYVGGGEDG